MDNIVGSSSLLDQVTKTLRVIGPAKLYKELMLLNNSTIFETEISDFVSETTNSQEIHKQIFLYLSSNSELELEKHLKNLQVKKPKISNPQFQYLLKIISSEFEINEDCVLHHKSRKTPTNIVNSRMVLYYLLWNYYGLTQREISALIFHSTRIVHKLIVQYKDLNERVPNDKIVLGNYKKIVEIIKNNQNANN